MNWLLGSHLGYGSTHFIEDECLYVPWTDEETASEKVALRASIRGVRRTMLNAVGITVRLNFVDESN